MNSLSIIINRTEYLQVRIQKADDAIYSEIAIKIRQ